LLTVLRGSLEDFEALRAEGERLRGRVREVEAEAAGLRELQCPAPEQHGTATGLAKEIDALKAQVRRARARVGGGHAVCAALRRRSEVRTKLRSFG